MLGTKLTLLSAAASGFAVIAVGRNNKKPNAFNFSVVASVVGLAILWPLARILTDYSTANLEGLLLFALGGTLTPSLVRLFCYSGLKKFGT